MNSWFHRVKRWLPGRRPRKSQLLPGLVSASLVSVGLYFGMFNPLENLAMNLMIRLRGALKWDDRVVLVTIDNKSLHELGSFPLPRSYYADLVRELTRVDASVIAFSVLFPDEGPDDPDLANAMFDNGRVVLAQDWDAQGQPVLPNPLLRQAAIAIGHTRQLIDTDGITRQIELILADDVPALGVASVQVYSLVEDVVTLPKPAIMQLNWPNKVREVPAYSLVDVLNHQVPDEHLKHKIVLVGMTATGTPTVRTPFDSKGPVPSVYLHAAAIDNLLTNRWLHHPSLFWVIGTTLLAGPVLSCGLGNYSVRLQIILWLSCFPLWWGLGLGLLYANYRLPIVAPLTLVSLSFGSSLVLGQVRASALIKARSEFLSTMSHELRTPMTAIVGMTDLLMLTELNPRQQDFVNILQNSSHTLLALINDILDFSKIEAGRLELEERLFSLQECVEQSLDLVATRAADKNLDIAYRIDPAVPDLIRGDSTRLRQILLNLLSNAVKFTSEGGVSLTVQMSSTKAVVIGQLWQQWLLGKRQRSSTTTDLIQFAVRDTGIGIPPEQFDKIFSPFSQVSAATTRQYGGTGLGLTICQRLVERMEGQIWVDSLVGSGSTFYFTIRALPAELEHSSTLLAPDLADFEASNTLENKGLLVIDTNITRREAIAQVAETWGVNPIFVSSVPAAQIHLQTVPESVHALFVDQALLPPDMTQEVLQNLRDSHLIQPLPTVMLLSVNQEADAIATDDTLIAIFKPLKQHTLHNALIQLLGHPRLNLDELPTSNDTNNNRWGDNAQRLAPLIHNPRHSSGLWVNTPLPSLRILLAEDNIVNQKVVTQILKRLGYEDVDVVKTGKEVLTALQHTAYDVVLMDIEMPEMNGLEATRRIRKTWATPQKPWIVALTANVMMEDQKAYLSAGMNDFLSKPLRLEDLQRALNRCITPDRKP